MLSEFKKGSTKPEKSTIVFAGILSMYDLKSSKVFIYGKPANCIECNFLFSSKFNISYSVNSYKQSTKSFL